LSAGKVVFSSQADKATFTVMNGDGNFYLQEPIDPLKTVSRTR